MKKRILLLFTAMFMLTVPGKIQASANEQEKSTVYFEENTLEEGSLTKESADNISESGTIGDMITWDLTEDGTLTIRGTGDISDYTFSEHLECQNIKKVVIEEGITSVGNRTFETCGELTSIELPKGITSIGDHAFYK